tara:strand:+ start:319 stop:600 length:282 start_codon:yes stop_codon:yes gene_type:complete
MLSRQPPSGYMGCSAAISKTDLTKSTCSLRLPTLVIAGTEDQSTPINLVEKTAQLIPDSRFFIIENAGHLPCVEKPRAFAEILINFLNDIKYV